MKHDIGATSFHYIEDDVPLTRDLRSGRGHNSRESCGVWKFTDEKFRDKAWKVFSKMKKYDKMKSEYNRARKIGVPTPAFEFKEGNVFGKDGRPRKGFALVTDYITSGRRLTLPHDCKVFETEVDSTTNIEVLEKIEDGLGRAIEFNLRDPQVFIDPKNVEYPIMFIDLHAGSTPPPVLKELRKHVLKRLNDVQS